MNMSQTEAIAPDQTQVAQELLASDTHFVKAVTEVADRHEMVVSEDIYARNGMKLVSSGTRLTGEFYDRLVAHKLLKPIEQSLRMDDAIDPPGLVELMLAQLEKTPALGGAELSRHLRSQIGEIRLPPALGLKLSVMQERRPKLFQHSLLAAIIATEIGVRARLNSAERQALALSSLFHDAGELYIDPAVLEAGHQLTAGERRHLYAHPITGFLILRDFEDIPRETATAVLQHHERLDGSGYPYRLSGEKIEKVSRVLSVAEVAASLLERNGADKRINMKLRLSGKKYDTEAVAFIGQLFSSVDVASMQPLDEVSVMTRLSQVGKLFEDWVALREKLSGMETSATAFVIERMNGLRQMVLETGFDPLRFEDAVGSAGSDDPEILLELQVLLDELEWQFRALSREVERKRDGQTAPRGELASWLKLLGGFSGE